MAGNKKEYPVVKTTWNLVVLEPEYELYFRCPNTKCNRILNSCDIERIHGDEYITEGEKINHLVTCNFCGIVFKLKVPEGEF